MDVGVIHKLKVEKGGARFGKESVHLIWGQRVKMEMPSQQLGVNSPIWGQVWAGDTTVRIGSILAICETT